MPATYSKCRFFIRCGSLLLVSVLIVTGSANPSSAADKSGDSEVTVPVETPKVAPPGLAINDEAEVAALVEIWKKVRGTDAPTVDPGDLAKALHRLKAQETEQKTRSTSEGVVGRGVYPNPFANKLSEDVLDYKAIYLPAVAPEANEPTKKDKLTSLRGTARKLDAMAEELDELELYEQADGLRQQAQTIRTQWRQIRTSENASRIAVPTLPGFGAEPTTDSPPRY
jgi:hypothetical protein